MRVAHGLLCIRSMTAQLPPHTFDVSDLDDAEEFENIPTAVYLTITTSRARTRRYGHSDREVTAVHPIIDINLVNLKMGE